MEHGLRIRGGGMVAQFAGSVDPHKLFKDSRFDINAKSFVNDNGGHFTSDLGIGSFSATPSPFNPLDFDYRSVLNAGTANFSNYPAQTAAVQRITVMTDGRPMDGYNPRLASKSEPIFHLHPMKKTKPDAVVYSALSAINRMLLNMHAKTVNAIDQYIHNEADRIANARSLLVNNGAVVGQKRAWLDGISMELATDPIEGILNKDPFYVFHLGHFSEKITFPGYSISASAEDGNESKASRIHKNRIITTLMQGRAQINILFGNARANEQIGYMACRVGTSLRDGEILSWRELKEMKVIPYRNPLGKKQMFFSSRAPLKFATKDREACENERSAIRKLITPADPAFPAYNEPFAFGGETNPLTRVPYNGIVASRYTQRPGNPAFDFIEPIVPPGDGVAPGVVCDHNDIAYLDVRIGFVPPNPNITKNAKDSTNAFDPAMFGEVINSGVYTFYVLETALVMPVGIVLFPNMGTGTPTVNEISSAIEDPSGNSYHALTGNLTAWCAC